MLKLVHIIKNMINIMEIYDFRPHFHYKAKNWKVKGIIFFLQKWNLYVPKDLGKNFEGNRARFKL